MKQQYNAPQFILDELINKVYRSSKKQTKGKIELEFRLQRFSQFFKGCTLIQQYRKGDDKFVWLCPFSEERNERFFSDVYLVSKIKVFVKRYEIDLVNWQFFQFVIVPSSWGHYEAFTSEMLFRGIQREYPRT